MTLTLLAFIAGSVVATFHMPFWWNTPSLGEVSLGDTLGWTWAVAAQLVALLLIAAATWWIERRRLGVPAPAMPPGGGWGRGPPGARPPLAGGAALAGLNALPLVPAR